MDRSTSEESLEIPEEPKEDPEEDYEKKDNDSTKRIPSAFNFGTAVRIARWMARAYGYVAKKRQAYLVSLVVTHWGKIQLFIKILMFEKSEFYRKAVAKM